MMIRAITAAAKGLSAKITSTIATLVFVRARTIPIDDALNAAPTAHPGRPILMTARNGSVRSRQMISRARLKQAPNERQNTVRQACGSSSSRMNNPPVLKIRDEVASSTMAFGDTRVPAGTYETATPPSPATAVTLSAAWGTS